MELAIFTRHQSQVQLSGGSTFGLDWHIFALPVINERPRRTGDSGHQDVLRLDDPDRADSG